MLHCDEHYYVIYNCDIYIFVFNIIQSTNISIYIIDQI